MQLVEIEKKYAKQNETITPGKPFTLSSVHTEKDEVWQGDLGIEVVSSVPKDYIKLNDPEEKDRQLVPFNGNPGSHHRIKSFDGVTIYRPKNWGKSDTDLRGPCVVFEKPNAIVHESNTKNPHGTVFIQDPMIVCCSYQRNYRHQQLEATRALD